MRIPLAARIALFLFIIALIVFLGLAFADWRKCPIDYVWVLSEGKWVCVQATAPQ